MQYNHATVFSKLQLAGGLPSLPIKEPLKDSIIRRTVNIISEQSHSHDEAYGLLDGYLWDIHYMVQPSELLEAIQKMEDKFPNGNSPLRSQIIEYYLFITPMSLTDSESVYALTNLLPTDREQEVLYRLVLHKPEMIYSFKDLLKYCDKFSSVKHRDSTSYFIFLCNPELYTRDSKEVLLLSNTIHDDKLRGIIRDYSLDTEDAFQQWVNQYRTERIHAHIASRSFHPSKRSTVPMNEQNFNGFFRNSQAPKFKDIEVLAFLSAWEYFQLTSDEWKLYESRITNPAIRDAALLRCLDRLGPDREDEIAHLLIQLSDVSIRSIGARLCLSNLERWYESYKKLHLVNDVVAETRRRTIS